MAEETLTKKDLQELLSEQTQKIEERFTKQGQEIEERFIKHGREIEERLAEQTDVILTAVDEKIKNLDIKFTRKLDELITTLDGFLKRMTDIEDEFTMMRNDINRIKKTIKRKTGGRTILEISNKNHCENSVIFYFSYF